MSSGFRGHLQEKARQEEGIGAAMVLDQVEPLEVRVQALRKSARGVLGLAQQAEMVLPDLWADPCGRDAESAQDPKDRSVAAAELEGRGNALFGHRMNVLDDGTAGGGGAEDAGEGAWVEFRICLRKIV